MPPAQSAALPAGKVSLVFQATAPFDTTKPLAGLWVDEWIEIVPSREETTAITFQYNPPDACAPQSVLLAVPPSPDEDWSIASLHRVLVETLDLAKLRATIVRLKVDKSSEEVAVVPLKVNAQQGKLLEGKLRELPPGSYRMELDIPELRINAGCIILKPDIVRIDHQGSG